MPTPVALATSPVFSLVAPGAAPIATDDSFLAINLNTGDQPFDVMLNDTFSGVPTITIVSQTGPGTATVAPPGPGRASRIIVPTGPGLASGTKTVTYQLTATGNTGSDTGVMTVVLNAPAAVTLPLTPAMDFLPSDGALLANPVYVYDTVLGNGSGSSPANAKEIQVAINAATAGTNLVAIAATAGGTTSYNRVNGLTFGANNGTSGIPITLMARPGDTVIIDRGLEFAAYRTPSSGQATKWELVDSNLHIWRSVATNFGAAIRTLGGVWFEGGHPHYILPCDTLAHLQAPNGTQRIWTNYGGPAALVNTDGRVYVRWQIPYPQKMSQNNKWPQDHRLDYIPGWVSGGQLRFPTTQDPRDVSIWLTDSPYTDLFTPSQIQNANCAFKFVNKSWWTIGEGINSFGHTVTYQVSGASNIEVRRGTDISANVCIIPSSADMPGPFTMRRRRMSQGILKHQSLLNWKFGGPLERGWRAAWAGAEQIYMMFGLVCRDCTIHGYHDIMTGAGRNWDIQQCTFIQCFDDGFQVPPAWFYNNNIHYCYFLDCVLGGPGQTSATGQPLGDALAPWYVSHCIFDNRCPKLVDTGTGYEPYVSMPMMQLHMEGGGEMPVKFFNNTVIFSPDQQGSINFWMTHIRGDNPAVRSYHEVFNTIYARNDYQRYYGKNPAAGPPSGQEGWSAQSDEIVGRCVSGGGSKELYDFIILHRDVPSVVNNLFREMVDTPVLGQAASSHGGQDFSSLSAWLASGKFNASKGIYPARANVPTGGFFANSYQVNPQMPSCPSGGNVTSFDARRNYRPAASQANNGYTGTTNAPSGESMASWLVKPDPWIGALDPNGTTCPVGCQNP